MDVLISVAMKHSKTISVKVGLHKFTLKDIEVYEKMSEETTALYAELYIDRCHIGHCVNSGRGEGNFPLVFSDYIARFNELSEQVAKHHFHEPATKDYPHESDWDYDMDFLIGMMVEHAWYKGRKIYFFKDEEQTTN